MKSKIIFIFASVMIVLLSAVAMADPFYFDYADSTNVVNVDAEGYNPPALASNTVPAETGGIATSSSASTQPVQSYEQQVPRRYQNVPYSAYMYYPNYYSGTYRPYYASYYSYAPLFSLRYRAHSLYAQVSYTPLYEYAHDLAQSTRTSATTPIVVQRVNKASWYGMQ